jgi:presenilin-like A22 family membrane protease
MNIRKHYAEFEIDWLTGVLVSLVVIIQGGAIVAAPYLRNLAVVPETQSTSNSLGVGLVAMIIIESLLIIGLWRLWKRLPELWKNILKHGAFGAIMISAFVLSYYAGVITTLIAAVAGVSVFFAIDWVLARYDLDWITFNLLAVALGVGATAFIGNIIAPLAVIPLLVIAMVWDYVAVDLSDIMDHIIDWSASSGLPNYLIIPVQFRIDYSAVKKYVKDIEGTERPPGVAGVIGVGDFMLPGLLTVSAWVAGDTTPAMTALVGTMIAMVVLRNSLDSAKRGLPALPWLNTGAMIGFGIGLVVI